VILKSQVYHQFMSHILSSICYSSSSCQDIALRPPFTLGLWNFIKSLLISCCYSRRQVCLSSLLAWRFVSVVFNYRFIFIPRSRHQKSSSLRINTSSCIRKKVSDIADKHTPPSGQNVELLQVTSSLCAFYQLSVYFYYQVNVTM